MRLGLLSDVHANLPALEAVLNDMPADVDGLVCLGDIVGYNPYPGECVERIREACDYVVQGNHDRTVRHPESVGNQQAVAGLRLAKETLDDAALAYLEALPETMPLADGAVLATHSHPERTDEYVFPSDIDDLERLLETYEIIAIGHTHLQHYDRFENGIIVNPGSVGQPRDEPRAGYAVIDIDAMDVELHRTSYDIWTVIEAINNAGLPEQTGTRLLPEGVDTGQNRNPWRRGNNGV